MQIYMVLTSTSDGQYWSRFVKIIILYHREKALTLNKCIFSLDLADSAVLIPSDRIFEVGGLKLVSEGRIIPESQIQVELTVVSKLPDDVW